jgi:hypothetical protein
MIHKIFSAGSSNVHQASHRHPQIAIPPPTRVVRFIMRAIDHSNTL